jgi:hypothetical protein
MKQIASNYGKHTSLNKNSLQADIKMKPTVLFISEASMGIRSRKNLEISIAGVKP